MIIAHLLIDSRTNGHNVYVDNWNSLNIPDVIHYKFYGIEYTINNSNKLFFIFKYFKCIFYLLFSFKNKFSTSDYLILHGTKNYIFLLPFLFSSKKLRFLIIHEEINTYFNIYKLLKIYNYFLKNKISFISVKKSFYSNESFFYLPPTISPLIRNLEILCDDSQKEFYFKFISIGNLNILKGYDLILENFPFKNLKGHYHIYGGLYFTQLHYINKVKKLIKSINSNTFQIKLMGQLSIDNVPKVILDSNCLLLPSRSEASPIVVLEALALGKIVIASNVGDLFYWASEFEGLFINNFKDNLNFFDFLNIHTSILQRAKKNRDHPILKGDYFYNFCNQLHQNRKL
jgi:glycosyltransferase involved in cell wall biosynthesis